MEMREEACAGTYRFEIDLMQTVQIDTYLGVDGCQSLANLKQVPGPAAADGYLAREA